MRLAVGEFSDGNSGGGRSLRLSVTDFSDLSHSEGGKGQEDEALHGRHCDGFGGGLVGEVGVIKVCREEDSGGSECEVIRRRESQSECQLLEMQVKDAEMDSRWMVEMEEGKGKKEAESVYVWRVRTSPECSQRRLGRGWEEVEWVTWASVAPRTHYAAADALRIATHASWPTPSPSHFHFFPTRLIHSHGPYILYCMYVRRLPVCTKILIHSSTQPADPSLPFHSQPFSILSPLPPLPPLPPFPSRLPGRRRSSRECQAHSLAGIQP